MGSIPAHTGEPVAVTRIEVITSGIRVYPRAYGGTLKILSAKMIAGGVYPRAYGGTTVKL